VSSLFGSGMCIIELLSINSCKEVSFDYSLDYSLNVSLVRPSRIGFILLNPLTVLFRKLPVMFANGRQLGDFSRALWGYFSTDLTEGSNLLNNA
jgi:hypothetical protein